MRTLCSFVLSSVILSSGLVRSDYPPPSEDGHAYYTVYGENDEGSIGRSETAGGRGAGTSFVGDWSDKDWQINYNQPKCLDIPWNLTLCRNIGYGQMRLPNLLEHDTLKEVTQQASSWVRLATIGCHPDTQIFLCSLFAPVCLDQPIWPCQTLCEAVKTGCESRMLQYGFPWPDMLRCDKFPAGTDLCIGMRNDQENETSVETVCSSCSIPESAEDDVLNGLCQADFVIRAKVEQSLVTGNDLKVVVSKKKKVFRIGSLKAKELREGVVFLEGGANCDCPVLDTVNGRRADDHVIIAGNRTGDHRLMVSLIQNVRSKTMRRVLRDLRKKDACRPGRTSNGGKKQNKKKKTGKSKKERVEEDGAGGNKRKNQKVQNKETKVIVDSPGKNSGRGNSKDSDTGKKRGNKAATEGQRTSSQRPREIIERAKEEKKQAMTSPRIMTSPRPAKKSTNHRRRPVVVSTQPEHRT